MTIPKVSQNDPGSNQGKSCFEGVLNHQTIHAMSVCIFFYGTVMTKLNKDLNTVMRAVRVPIPFAQIAQKTLNGSVDTFMLLVIVTVTRVAGTVTEH